MKLLIVIPAYNEEESIESIINRTLESRANIIDKTAVTSVDITVVSDGSVDNTVPLAEKYKDQIKIIVFEKNKGYGAAIKEGWSQSDADLLSFLDADGTCDPDFFVDLCHLIVDKNADVVLGCRLNPQSKMPLLRKTGNKMFSVLLTLFSSTRIRDTASGMRVVRRKSLSKLMPLPNGLHFTPAMSARAILSDDITIVEKDMAYHEREGESKLHALYDGIRFLKVILSTTFLYKPSRPLGIMGLLFFLFAAALMQYSIFYYIENSEVLEWMVYRFIVCSLLGIISVMLLCSGYLANKMVAMTLSKSAAIGVTHKIFNWFFNSKFFWVVIMSLYIGGGLLVLPSFIELIITGATYEHWSRFIVMSFFYSVASILLVTRLIDYTLTLVQDHLIYIQSPEYKTLKFRDVQS